MGGCGEVRVDRVARSEEDRPCQSHVDFGIGGGSHSKIHDIQKSPALGVGVTPKLMTYKNHRDLILEVEFSRWELEMGFCSAIRTRHVN